MNDLEQLKKEYLKTEIPLYLTTNGWYDLKQKLNQQESIIDKLFKPIFFAPVLIAAFLLVVIVSMFTKPGSWLYPVKVLSNQAIAELSGKHIGKTEGAKDQNPEIPTGQNPDLHSINQLNQQSPSPEATSEPKKEDRSQKEEKQNPKSNWFENLFFHLENRNHDRGDLQENNHQKKQ